MTEKQVIQWIITNLGSDIDKALKQAKSQNTGLLYDKALLAGMCMRETGFLIARYIGQGAKPVTIHPLMRGDYGQRPGEKDKSYHGYGYWQIDIGSFPGFICGGDWKDPYKTCVMAISVLEGKRKYLQSKFPQLKGEDLLRAIVAAYNCGEGNIQKVLNAGQDVDVRTHQHNYSKEVWRFREIAKTV